MNRPVYEKNMEALENKFPVWADILRANNRKKKNFDVIVEESYDGEPILKVDDHGRVYYLNGKYAPSQAVERWLEQNGPMNKFATIIIIGISNGVHIRRIMESVPRTVNILVYEPSYEIFRRAMEEVDLSFLFQPDIPVGIIVPKINGFEMERYFRYMIVYDNIVSLKIYMSGNYKELFSESIGEFVRFLKQYTSEITVGWNTAVRYTNVNAKNVFHNLRYLYEGHSICDLANMLPPDVPVIVVSAGPSLNKNIQDLKAAMGKACIIATDTAMKPLLNAGIVPDLFMIVDGLKPSELFEHKDISKCGMVTMTAVSTGPMDLHTGRKYFYYSGSHYEMELIHYLDGVKERKITLPNLPTGGSVGTSAYSLGVHMGARTVILVGQDLALTGNKVHVDGAFKDEKCEIDMESDIYMEVEAVDGGKVVTRADFKLYLDWFEFTIKDWTNINTIDATEGGALIHGAKNMTLKKAIQKYCTREYNARWHLARVPKLFETQEEKAFALRYFENSAKKLKDIKDKAEEGLRYYKRIQKLNPDSPGSAKQFQNTYKKIKKINNFMEKDPMAETVVDSLKGIEYTLRPSIYHTAENRAEELSDIVKQGTLMLKAIAVGAEEIRPLVEETLVAYARDKKGDKGSTGTDDLTGNEFMDLLERSAKKKGTEDRKEFLNRVDQMYAQLISCSLSEDTVESLKKEYHKLSEGGKDESIQILKKSLRNQERGFFLVMSALLGFLEDERIVVALEEALGYRDYTLWNRWHAWNQLHMVGSLFQIIGDEIAQCKRHRAAYRCIVQEMQELLEKKYPYLPYETRNKKVVILMPMLTDEGNAPTRKMAYFQKYLKELGYEVSVMILVSLTTDGVEKTDWYRPRFLYNRYEKNTFFSYEIEGELIEGCSLIADKDNYLLLLDKAMELIWQEKPEFVFSLGMPTPLAGLCNSITTVVALNFEKRALAVGVPIIARYFNYSQEEDREYRACLAEGQLVVDVKHSYQKLKSESDKKLYGKPDFGIPEECFVVMIAGNRLDIEIDESFAAIMKAAMDKEERIVFAMLGNCDSLRQFFQDTPYESRVYFLGWQDKFRESIAIADVFLNPPRKGGGGGGHLAILEEVPVITLGNCDVESFVGQDFVCSSVEEMPELVYRYCTDEAFMKQQKENCRIAAERNVNVDSVGNFRKLCQQVKAYALEREKQHEI